MRIKLLYTLTLVFLFTIPSIVFGQAPNLGTVANFVLFSSDGAVTNSGISQLTGKVGTNNGSSTGFGNVNGGMHDGDVTSAQAAIDLLIAYNQLNIATATIFPAPTLGGGQTLTAGVHAISGAATLNLELILDGQNNPNAVFIFKIAGAFSTNANSKVTLINGAEACNVFWKVEGLVDMATGTTMRGTVIANNAAINMSTGDTLEGRALSTSGAVTLDGVFAYTPYGCGSPVLTGPTAPTLGEVGCYGIFSSDGPVENTGITSIKGDVGANVGLTTGYDALLVAGNIHPIPDGSTSKAASDLLVAYNYLNGLAHDIELLYPAQFGGNLVLTPNTYVLNGATSLTDTVFLNAKGEANAVFVIKIYGALSTSSYSKVVLINGAQAKNVYWLINGAVGIEDHSIFNGTIVSQGAINLFDAVTLNGRALSGVGALSTKAIEGNATIASGCQTVVGGPVSVFTEQAQQAISMYPNPFGNTITLKIENTSENSNYALSLYNVLGAEVIHSVITNESTVINTSKLPSGIYIYRLTDQGMTIRTGRMITQ